MPMYHVSKVCRLNSLTATIRGSGYKFFVFREVLLDLVGINFRNCGTSIGPDLRQAAAGDDFDVGNVPFEWSLSAAVSRGALVTILLT